MLSAWGVWGKERGVRGVCAWVGGGGVGNIGGSKLCAGAVFFQPTHPPTRPHHRQKNKRKSRRLTMPPGSMCRPCVWMVVVLGQCSVNSTASCADSVSGPSSFTWIGVCVCVCGGEREG